jgi:hypothetical protein
MKQLISTYEQLKAEFENNHCDYLNQIDEIQEKYNTLQNHTEVIYENQMIETV